MKKKLTMMLSVALIAVMAICGTLAYLTSTDSDTNVMTLGNVEIDQIEKERVEQTNSGEDNLQEFQNDKPLYPAVGELKWVETEDGRVYQKWPTGGGSALFDANVKNIQDKFVFVENTGKSEAYVRTWFAFEAGNMSVDDINDGLIHWNRNETHWEWTPFSEDMKAEIDGVNYYLTVATYKGTDSVHTNGVLPAKETTRPSLLQVFLDKTATNEDIEAFGDTYEILAFSQAIQTNGFDNAKAALTEGFGEAVAANHPWQKPVFDGHVVSNDNELQQAVDDGYAEILLTAGIYNITDDAARGKTLTISSNEDAVIKLYNEGEDGCDYAFGDAGSGVGDITFNGVTIDTTNNDGNYKGFAYMKGTFNYCNFEGAYSLNNANDFVFNNCTFDFKNGYFWTWSAKSVTFNKCTFKGNSKTILAHGWESSEINIKDCKFAATEKGYTGSGDHTAAVEIDPAGTNTYTINFSGNNTKNENYAGWTRVKDASTGHIITGIE